MKISDIERKTEGKRGRIAEISAEIKALEGEISHLDAEIKSCVKVEATEHAIELTRAKRDKEDELEIHRQVLKSIETTPAVSHDDITNTWQKISHGINAQFTEIVLPELAEAYDRYVHAVEALETLCSAAEEKARTLKNIAEMSGHNAYLENPFGKIDLVKLYWPDKEFVGRLNCMHGVYKLWR